MTFECKFNFNDQVVIDGGSVVGRVIGFSFYPRLHQVQVSWWNSGALVEQWIGEEHTILQPGDSVYLDADVVHASFNVGSETAHLQVVLAPAVGDEGYQLVDVSAEQPWASLR